MLDFQIRPSYASPWCGKGVGEACEAFDGLLMLDGPQTISMDPYATGVAAPVTVRGAVCSLLPGGVR
jgi:hypothetical protein